MLDTITPSSFSKSFILLSVKWKLDEVVSSGKVQIIGMMWEMNGLISAFTQQTGVQILCVDLENIPFHYISLCVKDFPTNSPGLCSEQHLTKKPSGTTVCITPLTNE